MNERTLHQYMLKAETYPGGEGPIGFTETHVSRLYFTPRHVYKIKKAVDFGFLNFTTLDRRRFYCEEEVRLNRRFAPGTYLGVVEIRRTPEGVRISGSGEILEHAVWMNRLPADRMLDRLIAAGDPSLPEEMGRLGKRLAELHRESPVCRGNSGQSSLEIVQANWRENFRQIAPFVDRTISGRAIGHISSWVGRHLKEHASLILQRENDGLVRDAHGDLHAEHICLTDPLRIYDCIEFNRRFRVADIAADLAFLLMDLEFRGRRDLARSLLFAWRSSWGEDPGLDLLLPFYKIYRAFVRGKVNSFLADEETAEPAHRRQAAAAATQYFNLALGYLAQPALVLTSGLMGTGKSTIAGTLAAALGGTVLRSDILRKELAGREAAAGKTAPFDAGIYAPEFTRRTYDLLLAKTAATLAAGGSVVADASFGSREERDRFRAAARQTGVPSLTVVTGCPREIALGRLDARRRAGTDPSDGRPELYDRQAETFDTAGPEENAIRIDTLRDVDYNVQTLLVEIIEGNGTER